MRRSFNLLLIVVVCGLIGFVAACSATGTPAVKGPEVQEKKAGAEGEAGKKEGESKATEPAAAKEGETKATEPAATVAPTAAPTAIPTAAPTAEPTKRTQLVPDALTAARIMVATEVATSSPTASPTSVPTIVPTPSGPLTPITFFLTYTWNIQFAPVYVAKELGYFRDAGIDVSIEHSFDEVAGLTRIATNNLKFGIIGGDQVLLARAQGAPVTYVFTWYQKFPIGIVSKADANLTDPKQLKGKTVGVPGKFGASYMGLQALLFAAGLSESDLKEVKPIGFDTAPVVCGGVVEASVVYLANEPAQIEKQCSKTNLIRIADYANMVSNGLVTNEKTIAEQPDLVRGMAKAFYRGLEYTIANPDKAYEISRKYVETLAADDPLQKQVLAKSIELWKADAGSSLGMSDPAVWKRTLDTLLAMKLLAEPLDLSKAFTNDFVPR